MDVKKMENSNYANKLYSNSYTGGCKSPTLKNSENVNIRWHPIYSATVGWAIATKVRHFRMLEQIGNDTDFFKYDGRAMGNEVINARKVVIRLLRASSSLKDKNHIRHEFFK